MKNSKWLIVILIAAFVIYVPLLKGYFQHDELVVLGQYFTLEDKSLFNLLKISFTPFVSHFVPLHYFLVQIYISLFGLEFSYYALASIFAHLIISYLVFKLSSKFFKSPIAILLATTLFAFTASGHQATSWPLSDINVHGATLFGVLSLISILDRNITKSVIFLVISLLFKEITIGLFLFLPLVYMYYFPRVKDKTSTFKVFAATGLTYLSLRLLMFLAPRTHVQDKLVTQSQSIFDIVTNTVTFPIKVLVQSIIPPRQLIFLAKNLTRLLPEQVTGLYGTTQFDLFVEDKTLLALSVLIFGLIVWLLIKFRKNKIIWIGFMFVVINSVVYVLSPDRSGRVPVIDSRNLYFPMIGAAIFLTGVAFEIFSSNSKKASMVILGFVIMNVFWLNSELFKIVEVGQTRREILEQISNNYPDLPEKVVFYTVSDTSFYGLPESDKIFPYQTNFGSNLFVWYLQTEKFPSEMLTNGWFLYSITDEGYKEFNGRGFGYVRSFDKLVKVINENNLLSDSIIAFEYNSNENTLIDITQKTRKEISGE